MSSVNLESQLFDSERHNRQTQLQRKRAWDLDKDFSWDQPINTKSFLLPLDQDAVAFPGANSKQRLALSQYMGLVVNNTIAEMELVAHRLKEIAWRQQLERNPVNREFIDLGEEFFSEESKHAAAFRRYNQCFANAMKIPLHHLKKILPQSTGTSFLNSIYSNSLAGGYAFWWVVALVEEESILIFELIHSFKKDIDPLFFAIHQKHFEEESRHSNYAFLMLEHLRLQKIRGLKDLWHRKVDNIQAELWCTRWVIQELSRLFQVRQLAKEHEFFDTLASCLPLLEKESPSETLRRLFTSSPYVSSILNRRYHSRTLRARKTHAALGLFYPKPKPSKILSFSSESSHANRDS